MLLIVSFASLLLFFHQTEAAVTALTSTPANPSTAIETRELTLMWNYTLDGTVFLALFSNVTGGGNDEIARKLPGKNISVGNSYNDRFSAGVSDTHAWLKIVRVKRSDQGKYQLAVTASGSGSFTWAVDMIVQYPANFINVSSNQTVREGLDLQLFCEASGKPDPNITWTKISQRGSESGLLNRGLSLDFEKIRRTDAGTYRCKASNGVGNQVAHAIGVTVLFPPNIILQNEYYVGREKSVSLDCQVEGYPPPTIIWTPCNPQENVCDKSRLIISKVERDAVFNCAVKNNLGNASANTSLIIVAKTINVTLTITSEECAQTNKLFWKELQEAIDNVYAGDSTYTGTTLQDVRCGSLIVDLSLKFRSLVSDKWVLSILKEATKDGKLGGFNVAASSIKKTRPVILTSTSPLTGKTTLRSSNGNMIWIIVGAVLGCVVFIAVIVAVGVLYMCKQKKKSKNDNEEVSDKPGESHTVSYAESAGNTYNNAVEMEVRQPDHIPSWQQTSEVPSRSQYMALDDARRSDDLPEVTTTTVTSHTSQYAPLHPSTLSREIPRENVTVEKIIGKGAFGQVAKGTVFGVRERAQMTLVAVKMLKANAAVSDMKDLLSELEVMKTLKPHPHVIKLLGYVTESEPLLVLIEYVPYGDLLGYLRKSRGLNDTYYKDPDIKPQTSLTSQQLMKFSWQIADGMSYLSSRSIIHRDLAARNVLVGEKETCKVTDFGMARDVQQENIYEKKTKGRLPVKWTAYESLMYGTYTTKSDVWSYGVLLYEMFTIGGSPYPRMDGRKIASLLQQGYRMPKPQHVDDEFRYKIMTTCWEEDPDVRPTFAELRNKLKKMENQHKRLINMKMYDTQLYANVEDLVM